MLFIRITLEILCFWFAFVLPSFLGDTCTKRVEAVLKTIEDEIHLPSLEKDQLQILLQGLRKLLPFPSSSPGAMDWGYIHSGRTYVLFTVCTV